MVLGHMCEVNKLKQSLLVVKKLNVTTLHLTQHTDLQMKAYFLLFKDTAGKLNPIKILICFGAYKFLRPNTAVHYKLYYFHNKKMKYSRNITK